MVDGAEASWAAGVAAAKRDIAWLSKVSGKAIEVVEAIEPERVIAERASTTAANITKAVKDAIDKPGAKPPAADVREAFDANKWQLDRTAATENTIAFNDARSETVRESAKKAGVEVYEVWDAVLDPRTCPTCSELDGTYADEHGEWSGGLRPGWVHPGDRCTSHFTTTRP